MHQTSLLNDIFHRAYDHLLRWGGVSTVHRNRLPVRRGWWGRLLQHLLDRTSLCRPLHQGAALFCYEPAILQKGHWNSTAEINARAAEDHYAWNLKSFFQSRADSFPISCRSAAGVWPFRASDVCPGPTKGRAHDRAAYVRAYGLPHLPCTQGIKHWCEGQPFRFRLREYSWGAGIAPRKCPCKIFPIVGWVAESKEAMRLDAFRVQRGLPLLFPRAKISYGLPIWQCWRANNVRYRFFSTPPISCRALGAR